MAEPIYCLPLIRFFHLYIPALPLFSFSILSLSSSALEELLIVIAKVEKKLDVQTFTLKDPFLVIEF